MSTGGNSLGGVYVDVSAKTDAVKADFRTLLNSTQQIEAALVALKGEYTSGSIKTAEYKSRHDALTASLGATRAALQSVRDQIDRSAASTSMASDATQRYISRTGAAAAGTGKAGGSAGKAGYQFMQLGQTMDDLQYVGEMGLRPIINNVMQMSAVLGVAMIAGNLLYTHWDKLIGLMGLGAEKIKTEAEAMEELGKKTEKTANETARLNKYKETQDFGESIGKRSDKDEESLTKIKDLIRNNKGGAKALVGKLAAKQESEGRDKSFYLPGEEQDELKKLRMEAWGKSKSMSADSKKRMAELEEKAGDLRTNAINKQLYEGAANPEQQKRMVDQISRVDPELANKIRNEGTVEAAKKKEKTENYQNSDSVRQFAEQKKAAEDYAEAHNAEVDKREQDKKSDEAKAQEEYDHEVERNRDKFASETSRSQQDDYEKQYLESAAGESGISGERINAQFKQKAKRFLKSNGLIEDDEVAGDVAGRAADKSQEAAAAKLRDRMIQDQVGQQEAAKRLLEESRAKENQQAEGKTKAEEAKDDKARDEAEKQARGLVVGADDRIRSELMNARLAGATKEQAEDSVMGKLDKVLMSSGMDKESAQMASEEMVAKASDKMEEDVFQAGYNYKPEQQKTQAPQMMGAMQYLQHVQSGVVGNTHERKVEDLLRMIYTSNQAQADALNRPRPAVIGD